MEKVYDLYDKIVDWFDNARTKTLMEKEYLDLIAQSIPKAGSILDLGCGTGEPIAKFFIGSGYKLTGVDGSQKMIELCRTRFPENTFIAQDMLTISLTQKFDAILAWHSLFHLTRENQRKMFAIFQTHIKPNGILAFTSGTSDGEIWSNNGGQNLYHASLSTEEYSQLLEKYNFKTLLHRVEDPNCGDSTIWIAQQRPLQDSIK